MNFIRRLIGIQEPDEADNADNTPVSSKNATLPMNSRAATAASAARDTQPKPPNSASALAESDAPATTAPTATSTSTSTATPTVKRSMEEINEAARVDPTPMITDMATKQLPPLDSSFGKPTQRIVYGFATDQGMIRSNNQDSMLAVLSTMSSVEKQPDFGLFIVADGMGGHHEGEKASAIAARTIGEYIVDKFYLPILKGPNLKDVDRPIISEVLSDAVQNANTVVSEEIPEGGTTVTAAVLLNDLLYVAHVGDSRAYLITKDGIEQVTRDHSLVQRLIELDQLTPDEAAVHPQRNVLYRAIGQSENLEIDAVTRRLGPGTRLLICCDGLWNQVSDETMLQVVKGSKTPQEACDHLIKLANDRGGPDNITLILVQVPG